MNAAFERLVDTIGLPLPEGAIRETLFRFAKQCGFEHFSYLWLKGCGSFMICSYPLEWQQRYIKNSYLLFDPVVTDVKRGKRLFNWSVGDALLSAIDSVEMMQFYEDSLKFRIRSGLSIAIPTGFSHYAVVTLASNQRKFENINAIDPTLAATTAALIHGVLNREAHDLSLVEEVGLSPREATCLRWVAEGKSIQETAQLLGIGFRTVRGHLDAVKDKLAVRSIAQAVAIASRLQLI